VSGYILDDLALSAGLVGTGTEYHRREVSRLLHAAVEGGPTLDIPALCLSAAAAARPALAGHLADIVAGAPAGAVDVCGLTRTGQLDQLRAAQPGLDWPATHAAVHALATGLPILTVMPGRYADVPVDVMAL
jgi:hypothetical protein